MALQERKMIYALGDTTNVIRRYDVAAKNILVDSKRHLLFAITQKGLQAFPIDHRLLFGIRHENRHGASGE